jgi:hypothetical protein
MSTTTLSASTAADTRAPAPRPVRLAAPILMPLAPALTLVSGLFLSLDPDTLSEAELTAAVYADPSRQGLLVWSGFFEALLFPIAVIWAGRATYARAPRLTTAAMILAVPGYLCLAWLVAGSDAIVWYGATHGLDQDLVTDMAWGVHPAFNAALGTFVIGHTLGMVLLGMAAIRSRAIPLWAGVGLAVSQPIHFVVGALVNDPTIALGLNTVSGILTVLGLGLLGRAIFRGR